MERVPKERVEGFWEGKDEVKGEIEVRGTEMWLVGLEGLKEKSRSSIGRFAMR